MEDNRIDHLETRVEKLEDTVAPLSTQMNMLIDTIKQMNESIKETNSTIKDMSRHMESNYVSEKVCGERCGNSRLDIQEFKGFRTWVYLAVISGLSSLLILLITFVFPKIY